MSMGPPDEIDDSDLGPDDVAMPTRPSERGAWRGHGPDDTDDTDGQGEKDEKDTDTGE
jgi:hypothetical protein